MQDRPSSKEILQGVYGFLENELVPVLQGPLRFHTLVAANLLKIIEREQELEGKHLLAEWNRLLPLLGLTKSLPASVDQLRAGVRELNEELCLRIRNGHADSGPWRQEVISHIRQSLLKKLEVSNPKYLEGEIGVQ